MRITDYQKNKIKKTALEVFGTGASVYLFGSRIDDTKKGGDIDIFIECEKEYNSFKNELIFISKLTESIGEQKIDLVIKSREAKDEREIVYEIFRNGILL